MWAAKTEVTYVPLLNTSFCPHLSLNTSELSTLLDRLIFLNNCNSSSKVTQLYVTILFVWLVLFSFHKIKRFQLFKFSRKWDIIVYLYVSVHASVRPCLNNVWDATLLLTLFSSLCCKGAVHSTRSSSFIHSFIHSLFIYLFIYLFIIL
jgi:hypothetical protein